jgi:hypothetical protein
MIQRVVLVQMKPEHRSDAKLREVARKALEVLPHAARARDVKVHIASDERTRDEWDLCILVRFESMGDAPVYRVDPIHRSFADRYLKPLRERIFVYHFDEYTPQIPISKR